MLPDQPRDANNLLRKVILGNIFNRFFTVPKVQPTLFILTLAAHTRPPEAAESQFIIVLSSIIYKEKISILFCCSRTRIPLLLCKSRHSAYSTTFTYISFLHTYAMLIYGM